MPGLQTTFASIGPRWANVANSPYVYSKAEFYEGGIHTPMLEFWPKGIRAKKGSFSAQVGQVMDFMQTFVELAGTTYPTTYNGRAITPTIDISLVPSLSGKTSLGQESLFNGHFGARYARSGNWKLVSTSRDTNWRLYDLATDGSETQDIAARHPDKVQQLDTRWRAWANTHQVFPKPGKKPY